MTCTFDFILCNPDTNNHISDTLLRYVITTLTDLKSKHTVINNYENKSMNP